MMKKRTFFSKTALLFGAAALLLGLSTVGSTRAALNYRSQSFGMEVSVSNIGVSLEENGTPVSARYYEENEVTVQKPLLGSLLEITEDGTKEAQQLQPGKNYKEELRAVNKGQIDCYVRVTLRRSWVNTDQDGKVTGKDTALAPELIRLNMDDGKEHNGWIVDSGASGLGTEGAYREQLVLYYTRPLKPGEATNTFNETLGIDYRILQEMVKEKGGYEDRSIMLEAEVDAVQAHNAEEAIRSAWGVDADIAPDNAADAGVLRGLR